MSDWFAYIERELERFIRQDPFDEIISKLGDETPFAFSRFGDGEFGAIFGVGEANCDGHPYFPDLGRRLKSIVESNPSYMMGLQPLAVLHHGICNILQLAGERNWVLADSLHRASVEARLGELFEALSDRDVTLVGPEHLRMLSERHGWALCLIPERKCWTEYESVLGRLKESLATSGGVVLFCASMMSNVLIDDLHAIKPGNTYIDAGSVLDPFAGVETRDYHATLGSEARVQIAIYGSGHRR